MKVEINVYPATNGDFIASYIDPLSKNRIRESFADSLSARKFKRERELEFEKNDLTTLWDRSIDELLIYFNSQRPKNDLFKSNIHLADFSNTFGKMQVTEFNSDHAKWWFDLVQKENKLKDISMRGIKCKLDSFFKFLVKQEIITQSPLTEVFYEKASPSIKSRNILSQNQISKLLDTAQKYSRGLLYPILKLVTETGCKTQDIIDLTWPDIDLSTNTIHFREGERIQARSLKVSEELIEMIKLFKHRKGSVFQTHYKTTFTKNKLAREVKEFMALSKLDLKWNFMDLRHSYSVSYLQSGNDIKDLKYRLGHKSIHETRKLYNEALSLTINNN